MLLINDRAIQKVYMQRAPAAGDAWSDLALQVDFPEAPSGELAIVLAVAHGEADVLFDEVRLERVEAQAK